MATPGTNSRIPISESIVKTRFMTEILTEEAEAVYALQRRVVEEWNLFRSNELYQSLVGHFNIDDAGGGIKLVMRYLAYMRFLDIPDIRRKRKSYHLYNKILFGRIYNDTYSRLKYGLTEEIRSRVTNELARELYMASSEGIKPQIIKNG